MCVSTPERECVCVSPQHNKVSNEGTNFQLSCHRFTRALHAIRAMPNKATQQQKTVDSTACHRHQQQLHFSAKTLEKIKVCSLYSLRTIVALYRISHIKRLRTSTWLQCLVIAL